MATQYRKFAVALPLSLTILRLYTHGWEQVPKPRMDAALKVANLNFDGAEALFMEYLSFREKW